MRRSTLRAAVRQAGPCLPLVLALAACGNSNAVTPDQAPAPMPVHPMAPAVGAASGYDKPPQNVLDVLHAPSPPTPSVNPTGDTIMLISMVEYPPMARVAEPYLGLAGVRVEPRSRRKHDTPGGYGITPCVRTLALVAVATTHETPVALPPGGCVDAITWAADGKHFAFANTLNDAVQLWTGDATTGAVHQLGDARLNPMLGDALQWLDDKTLLVKLVPADAGPAPQAPLVPNGPSIQETDGKSGKSSTYEARDTLKTKHDEDLFEYYGTSQVALVDAATGAVTKVGAPAIITGVDASPDAAHLLVDTIKRPFSYAVTFGRFAHDVAVWDRSGHATVLASLPIADRVPIHGVPTGPRDFGWRGNQPATLLWAEALDGGDWNTKVPARDKVMMQPVGGQPVEIARTEQRFAGFRWGEQANLALMYENDANRHWNRTFVVDVDDRAAKPKLLWDLSSDEHYKDPGAPVMREVANGVWLMRQDGDAIFLRGTGSSPQGDRPFLDRLDLKTSKSDRLFHCDETSHEQFIGFSGAGFLTWHQSPSDPPNAFLRVGTAAPVAVTHIPDPTPAVRSIKKRLVKYKRKDGLDLSFTLLTPPDYKEGTRVPAILYAYPLDYADAAAAGQVTGSEQTFVRLRQYQLLLLAGYAIIDNAAFPIVGDPKKAYDTYLDQLVEDARAAVDKAVELGVVDRDRIGVTGHSHGALMTANLVAHSDLFRAGVATSGSYNKTLTPFGFQSERRSVWEAPEVYLKVSPFFVADKLKLPLLIVHGEEDANPGTTPLQAVKLYEAIRGNGGISRLVMLPHEPHWYSAMESNEQLSYEMIRWFDTYVKPPKPAK